MRIVIETVPFKEIPNAQCGDWRRDADGTLQIKVAEEIGDKFALLVALHEFWEQALCEDRDISCEKVDAFDKAYERTRPENDQSEPGDHPDCPYAAEHCAASGVERLLASELEVKWADYENSINSLK